MPILVGEDDGDYGIGVLEEGFAFLVTGFDQIGVGAWSTVQQPSMSSWPMVYISTASRPPSSVGSLLALFVAVDANGFR